MPEYASSRGPARAEDRPAGEPRDPRLDEARRTTSNRRDASRVAAALATSNREARRLRSELDELHAVMLRRSKIDQAKGILMERHSIDASTAFERIRHHARSRGVRVVDISLALICAHELASDGHRRP